jgi:hypothetical protein
MKRMRFIFLSLIIVFSSWGSGLFAEEVKIEINIEGATIENNLLAVNFNLTDGKFDCFDKSSDINIIEQAWYRLDPGETEWGLPPYNYESVDLGPVNDKIGVGKRLRVWYRPQESYDPERFIDITVYQEKSFIVLNWGVHNQFNYTVRVREAELISQGLIFSGQLPDDPKVLRSGAGSTPNFVEETWEIEAYNGAMLSYTDMSRNDRRHTIVGGGLHYKEFARSFHTFRPKKRNEQKDLSLITLSVWDPEGKYIQPGETWSSYDSYYLDFSTKDPFVSLEQYGEYLALANDANPNKYDFPTLCGWMVSTKAYGEGENINHSPGLVDQMIKARDSGILKYTTVAVRLEPDFYCYTNQGNTEQGWWDDEHWALFGHLREPYETFNKFCKAVNSYGGKVFTYFQASLPSNDFAREHPEWMLNDDISLLHVDHFHHHPLIRYDYTNPDFQTYVLNMWKRLGNDGVEGIKFDYPETGWARNGGFDDNSYTTTSAYREIFKLCREGLGEEAFIHERALGESETPRLDCTVGIVDLQRVWGDASHFEPEMASRIGLRWFKQGKAFRYYPDGKSFYSNGTPVSIEERRSIITLVGLLSGRLELGTSFGRMTTEMMYDLARIYPVLPNGKSFRPVDMFMGKKNPEVYEYTIDENWKQVIVTNSNSEDTETISVPLSGDQVTTGSLGLERESSYCVFDFWNQKYLGIFPGEGFFNISLGNKESDVYAFHKALNRPQIIGTSRHIMCGMMELSEISWDSDEKTLSFIADLPEGEAMDIFIAVPKDFNLVKASAEDAISSFKEEDGLIILNIESGKTGNFISLVRVKF